jgi:transposase
LPGGLWPVHDDLQPFQSLEPTRRLARDVRSSHWREPNPQHGLSRQFARQSSSLGGRRKRGAFRQAIGRSRGGRTTKIHALTDDDGRPRVFALSPGNIADISLAAQLISAAGPIEQLIADKGYDANHLRRLLADRGAQAVIPSTASRNIVIPHDPILYRQRNLIERMFGRLKDFRRVATRYDKLARNFLATIALAALVTWWLN